MFWFSLNKKKRKKNKADTFKDMRYQMTCWMHSADVKQTISPKRQSFPLSSRHKMMLHPPRPRDKWQLDPLCFKWIRSTTLWFISRQAHVDTHECTQTLTHVNARAWVPIPARQCVMSDGQSDFSLCATVNCLIASVHRSGKGNRIWGTWNFDKKRKRKKT